MRIRRGWYRALSVALTAVIASGVAPATPAVAAGESVSVWLTTSSLSQKLTPQAALTFTPGAGSAPVVINLNEGRTYQTMVGFGATFTDSAAWLMHEKATPANRGQSMQDLFSRNGANGIGLNLLRQPMSATDYIKTVGGYYTYDDMPAGQTDPTLANFSIAHDLDYIVPILQQALQINPSIKVQFNSWTAPAWMKTNGSLVNGGSLLPQYHGAYASYIVKAIQAYEAQGIPIWATSVANEPTVVRTYPTMTVPTVVSSQIIEDHLVPGLAAAGLTTRVLAADDVEFGTGYTWSVIDSDPVVSAELPASSLHGYWGDPAALTRIHNRYPNKDLYQTELSPGCSYSPIQLIINTTRNWAQTAITWNVALDNDNGPYHANEPNTCKPLVRVDQATGSTTYTDAFYQEGQVSKFVLPGAVRIESNDHSDVRNVAFKNPDGSKVFVAWNSSSGSRSFSLNWGNQHVDYTIAAGSVATFTWAGTPAGDAAGWGNSTFGSDASNLYGGGLQIGQWSITNASTLTQNGLGGGQWPSVYYGYADRSNLTAAANMRAIQSGTTSQFPKYGMYACYRDQHNYVQAWIDPGSSVYATHARQDGVDLGWVNNPLPVGFVAGVAHNISVRRTDNTYTFYLDGVQQQTRSAILGAGCQLGLVTEDYRAEFTNVALIDPSRWGSSQLGTNAGNIWDGGVRRGDWAVAGVDSTTINTLGTGWSSIYRGYVQGNQTVSVRAQGIKPGTTASWPKYGVYAAYRNQDNYVQGWIDPTSDNFVTHARVSGVDLGWVNNPLPGGFNEKLYHTISVTRSANTFTFLLDGVQQQTRVAMMGDGQFGLVSEDYRANFRQATVTGDPPSPGLNNVTWYFLYNRRSLRELSVLSGGTANSTPTIIYDPVEATDQMWRIVATGGGWYQLINQRSGRALSVLNGGTANSTSTIIYDNIGATDQYWSINPSPAGAPYVRLINQRSGRALSVLGGGTANSTHTIIYDDIGATDQDWIIVPVR